MDILLDFRKKFCFIEIQDIDHLLKVLAQLTQHVQGELRNNIDCKKEKKKHNTLKVNLIIN